jgi:hypothetical protein
MQEVLVKAYRAFVAPASSASNITVRRAPSKAGGRHFRVNACPGFDFVQPLLVPLLEARDVTYAPSDSHR